jgi:hypothetical protein
MFYSSDAPVPEMLRTEEFLLRPLRATDVQFDYDAVISSGGTWPREGFTLEEDLADLERHEREHHERFAFTYTMMNPLTRLLGHDAGSDTYLSDNTAYVSFWVRSTYLADGLDKRLLTALIPWFLNEWAFLHVLFFAQKREERQIQLFEEMGLRLLYSIRPHQPFLDTVLAYVIEPTFVRTKLKQ